LDLYSSAYWWDAYWSDMSLKVAFPPHFIKEKVLRISKNK